MKNYEKYLEEKEGNKLNEKIANVKKVIDNKEADAQSINQAAQDLKAERDRVFNDCELRKNNDKKDPPDDVEPVPEEPSDSQNNQ